LRFKEVRIGSVRSDSCATAVRCDTSISCFDGGDSTVGSGSTTHSIRQVPRLVQVRLQFAIPKRAGVPVPTYQQFWADKRSAIKTKYRDIVSTHSDAAASMHQLFKVLCDIEDFASFTPSSVGESRELP
jgi:hypothetical protein